MKIFGSMEKANEFEASLEGMRVVKMEYEVR